MSTLALAAGKKPTPNYIDGALLSAALGRPIFTEEGPQDYAAAYQHNAPFAKPGPYSTQLAPVQEQAFRAWVAQNHIPFDPNAKTSDYDMRGFFAAGQGQGRASNGHFPDTFKTPYDTMFSGESKYAKPGAPFVWKGNTLVDARTGQVIFGGSRG